MSESEKVPSDALMQAMTRPPLVWPGITSDWALYTVVLPACSLFIGGFVMFGGSAFVMAGIGVTIQKIDPHLLKIWEIRLIRCVRPCAVSRFMGFRVYGE